MKRSEKIGKMSKVGENSKKDNLFPQNRFFKGHFADSVIKF